MTQKNEVLSSASRSPGTTGDAVIIEVVSDVVCPWCFIEKRRLEKALKLLERQGTTGGRFCMVSSGPLAS